MEHLQGQDTPTTSLQALIFVAAIKAKIIALTMETRVGPPRAVPPQYKA